MLRNTGVCDEVESENDNHQIETFCNRVAGFVLVPREMLAEMAHAHRTRKEGPSDEELVNLVRRRCRTSRHVAALRLEADGYVPFGTYHNMVQLWAEEDWRPHSRSGVVPYRYRILNEKGHLYSTILLRAWRNGSLSSLEVSRFMEAKAPHLEEVASELEL
jgi:Zn-dependent peptidase ImmA (M78 family)